MADDTVSTDRALGRIEGKLDSMPDLVASAIAKHHQECRKPSLMPASKMQGKFVTKLIGAIVALVGLVVYLVKG